MMWSSFPPGRIIYYVVCSNVVSYICEVKRKKGDMGVGKDNL